MSKSLFEIFDSIPQITIFYSANDGYKEQKTFNDIKSAKEYAEKWVGKNPDLGRNYAVSEDGIGKIVVKGITLEQLFADENYYKKQTETRKWKELCAKFFNNVKSKLTTAKNTTSPIVDEDFGSMCFDYTQGRLCIGIDTYKGLGVRAEMFYFDDKAYFNQQRKVRFDKEIKVADLDSAIQAFDKLHDEFKQFLGK